MRAVVVDKPGSFAVTSVPDPMVGPVEVVVQVAACGICGTDLHIVDGEFPPTPYPIVPGHEAAGTVVAVGAQVTNVRVGDRVAVDPSLFCGSCKYCRAGRGNLCERWGATGDTVDGAFAEYVSVPARNCYTVPDEMSFSSAAMVEPVSCAVHAVDRLGVVVGDNVLVFGAGTMGLVLGQLLGHAGARTVSFVDTNPAKLNLARSFGFEECYATLEEAVGAHGRYERVVEATGVALVAERAIDAVARGGTLMIFGVAPSGALARYRPFAVYNDEVSIVGSMAVLSSYGRAVDIVADGIVKVPKMVTHTFALDDFATALGTVRRGEGLKVQVSLERLERDQPAQARAASAERVVLGVLTPLKGAPNAGQLA
jgi:2-desacetyl-2-hydroxyethyl bacteriochlorophyllide A dehydrogenase